MAWAVSTIKNVFSWYFKDTVRAARRQKERPEHDLFYNCQIRKLISSHVLHAHVAPLTLFKPIFLNYYAPRLLINTLLALNRQILQHYNWLFHQSTHASNESHVFFCNGHPASNFILSHQCVESETTPLTALPNMLLQQLIHSVFISAFIKSTRLRCTWSKIWVDPTSRLPRWHIVDCTIV